MSVKLRLRRMGRTKIPVFSIVATDSRNARDGRYIEDLGRYYPLEQPATVKLDEARTFYWLEQGAQPSDTVRSILSKRGLLLALHLKRKGHSPEEVQAAVQKHLESLAGKGEEMKMTAAMRREQALEAERKRVAELEAKEREEAEKRRKAEEEARKKAEEEARKKAEEEAAAKAEAEAAAAAETAEGEEEAEASAEGEAAEASAEAEAATETAEADEAEADTAEAGEEAPEASADEADEADEDAGDEEE